MIQGYLFDEPYFDNLAVSFIQVRCTLSQILIYQAHYDIYLHNRIIDMYNLHIVISLFEKKFLILAVNVLYMLCYAALHYMLV